MPREFLSCDWGTSSFRIRWIRDSEVVREFHDKTGCRTIHEEAIASGEQRPVLYERFLRKVLSNWPPAENRLPLVISGMASSSIGWIEVPYAPVPLKLNASDLRSEKISWNKPGWLGETYLISGVATENEMMRGEETEAIGLLDEGSGATPSVLVLPGTHSKHVFVANGRIENISTYMTGELFDVLARYSILKATVDCSTLFDAKPADSHAFDAGVRQGAQAGLGASLFQARARVVLKKIPATENAWFLSGLLIGAEIADSVRSSPKRRFLIGGAKVLRGLYAKAMRALELWSWNEFDDDLVEKAVPNAHALFLKHLPES
jgi:2-dehydro-3-deoxygalactonokinase